MQNVLCWRNATNETVRRYLQSVSRQPVLITARIDADRPETARRLMDDAVAAEAKGLSGKIYLDAQGLPLDRSKGLYDANLRELAAMIQSYTQLDVTLNNRKALFGPGECPNTMLYCGWYSLRKYINSFTFVPGAVGYHIASFEAMSLKRRGEQGWVVNMLKEGAASSIGPVAEPYLHSFPLPKDFFGLLLTGEFTLGEVYAYTCPLTSWMQMLIGDPLYRPFGRKKHLTIEQVFEPELIPEAFRPATTTTAPE